ncbi:hypothetical protein [Bacillus sp. AFS041924]|uniref:hypothetical protein n=1 Tax=Bacillus sp. AFS041924 TaxID=2033503 RepID=UPI000BFD7489|nr:hypothetical protein [Bacillus sp. AFS041924]PGS50971.1 hypothetical protein COC46_12510 [Bacillus sp. AFS041924]
MKLGSLMVFGVTAIFVEIVSFMKDKLHSHFQYENVIYFMIISSGLTVFMFMFKKINPSITNKKINGIISTCVLVVILIILPYLLSKIVI